MSFDTDPPHILTAEEIWAAQDIEERTVEVPQWGGSVRIRTFSKKQADAMRQQATVKDRLGRETVDNARLEALLFCEGLVEPKFDPDEYERMSEKSAAAVQTVLKAILDASGLSELAVAEADKSARARPGTTIRVLPGAGASNDTGGAIAADVSA